ncbi:palmitoyltransferase ZDHHC1 [Athalia rosae]|uniref:palmitoyltransferase ZDHHC1 n=1 Tax=Athalia rosae TaxID=37344 RepID=UPI0020349888|nr:palmitoyltransferase ZDHHC1 [Athalia rosae]
MRKGNWRISRFCTAQNCCTAFANPEQKSQLRRLHGLQFPLHPQQVVGWIALFGIAVGTFTTVLPHSGPNIQPIVSALIGVTFTLHVAAHLVALLLDPADPQVRAQSSRKIIPEFDRTKHLHVIENGRCHLCNINTTNKRTKHCSICNKCIAQFDHHCKWLNNCIGGRNYIAFIVCVISAVVSALAVTGVSVAELALINVDGNILTNWHLSMDNVTLPTAQSTPGTGSLIVISLVGILSAIAAALLIHLCFFHGYIACLGITTYEYVRNKRDRKIAKGVSSEENEDPNYGSKCPTLFNGNMGNQRVRYQFRKSNSSNEYNDDSERSVYICSTHQRQSTSCSSSDADKNVAKDKRNFHLYFSYETRDTETSIEVSSQSFSNDVVQKRQDQSIEFKPSTPSPVSCCFSIISGAGKSANVGEKKSNTISSTTKQKFGQQKIGISDKERGPRSCLTIRRIQSFLRTRLRRNPRQKSINGDLQSSRTRKNKVNPAMTADNDDSAKRKDAALEEAVEVRSDLDASSTGNEDKIVAVQFKPPVKLPPLVLPTRHRIKVIPSIIEVPIAPPKRSQSTLRIRRTSFYKRPRFKMGPHVTEIAQLSPIPESELSKPASPRTPTQINHFPFPPPNCYTSTKTIDDNSKARDS